MLFCLNKKAVFATFLLCASFIAPVHCSKLFQDVDDPSLVITSFWLVNPETNEDIPPFTPLSNGDEIDLRDVGTNLNIRADYGDVRPRSVVLELNNGEYTYTRTERKPPFALFGDFPKGDYFDGELPLGMNTLTATPYSRKNGNGDAGIPLTIQFTVVETNSSPSSHPSSSPSASPTASPDSFTYVSEKHIFSIDDVQGDFRGNTFADDNSIICGVPDTDSPPCPPEGPIPTIDKDDTTILYPIDSTFGFYVVDFLGAQAKERDDDYKEGFAGDIFEDGEHVGVRVSNTATDTYKVPPPLGTWCQGLTATAVKCSTEHFVSMEHVLTCHETVPYQFADPITGMQNIQSLPDGSASFDCKDAELDNTMQVLVDGSPVGEYDPTGEDGGPDMDPNDNTDVRNNIAVSSDYSITLKDDGKVLYRWGSLIKRPNDLRLYAKLALPEAWKESGADFKVTKAYLVVDHWITNNPNDQIRPEDIENEAATGRKPDYRIDVNGTWLSGRDCFEGDADVIAGDDGTVDPTAIPAGTVLKNPPAGLQGEAKPQILSSDLEELFTNGWYTTINRDPFEWSYRNYTGDDDEYKFFGSAQPLMEEEADEEGLTLVSGPRWRLKAGKFGQDLPGLEIPLIECSEPPFEKSSNIKYEVGERVQTTVNLLDWEEGSLSPLATSKGWVNWEENDVLVNVTEIDGKNVTSNGLPMTEDFDLAIYIKGDKKPTTVYSAQLFLDYEEKSLIFSN